MYNLDPKAAKEADQMGGRIDETGKYTGLFTRAENVMSTKGTKGVEFSFKSDDGRSADFLTLWTVNNEGKELYGYKALMAIMTCLKVRSLSPVRQQVEKYDFELNAKTMVDAEVFQELMNKPIGLLLQREEYRGNNGGVKSKMVIAVPFDPATNFTASEILDKAAKPEALEKILARLRDRPLKEPANQPSSQPAQAAAYDDFDDSIPF